MPPDEKRPEPGTPVTFDEELTAQKLTPVAVQTPAPPATAACAPRRLPPAARRRCRDAGDHHRRRHRSAHTSGTRSTAPAAAQPAATPPAATAPAAAGAATVAAPGQAPPPRLRLLPPPRPSRPRRPAGDGAVHAPFVCRAWRDPQGAGRERVVEPPVAAARAAGAAAEGLFSARVSETAVTVEWDAVATATAYNVYRGDDVLQPVNPAPLKSPRSSTTGVAFGQEQCYRVRSASSLVRR